MKKKLLYLSGLFIFLFSCLYAQPVSAHGGEPRIEIGAERLNPGAGLDIRGVDFEFEEQIVLILAGPQVEIPLGSAIADAEGIFQLTITIPVDLVEGTYIIRGTTDDHVVDSPQITVWGSAVVQGGEDRLDEDAGYGLLAPMPTFAPGVSSTPLPETAALEPPVSKRDSTTLIYSILFGIGIVALLSIRILKKR